jgi:hypothetical protein
MPILRINIFYLIKILFTYTKTFSKGIVIDLNNRQFLFIIKTNF